MDASSSQGVLGVASGSKTVRGASVKRPMNSFLIFCKRHRALMHEKHPSIDNRSVTRMLGDLWKSILPEERAAYENLSKQNKDAFYKANPDFKWRTNEPATSTSDSSMIAGDSSLLVSSTSSVAAPSDEFRLDLDRLQRSKAPIGEYDLSVGFNSTDAPKLITPINMLLMASQQSPSCPSNAQSSDPYDPPLLCSSVESGKVKLGIVSDRMLEDVKSRGKRTAEAKEDVVVKVKRKRRTKKVQALEIAASQKNAIDPHPFGHRSPDSTSTKDERNNTSGSVDMKVDNKTAVFPSVELIVDHDSAQNKLYQMKLVPVLQYGEQQNLSSEPQQQQQLNQHQFNLLLQQTLKMQPYQLLYPNSHMQAAQQQLNHAQQQMLLANHQSSKLQLQKTDEQQPKIDLQQPGLKQSSGVLQLPSNSSQLSQQHVRLIQQNYQLQQGEQMIQLHSQQRQHLQQNEQILQQLQQQQQVLTMALQLAGKLPVSGYTEILATRSISNTPGSIRQPWLDSSGKKFASSSSKETSTSDIYKSAQVPDHSLQHNAELGLNMSNNIPIYSTVSNSLNNITTLARDIKSRAISFPRSSHAQSQNQSILSIGMNSTSSGTLSFGCPLQLFAKPADVSCVGNFTSSSPHSSVVDLRQTDSTGCSLSTSIGLSQAHNLSQTLGLRRVFAEQPIGGGPSRETDGSYLNKQMFDKVIEVFHSKETQQDQEQLRRTTAEFRSFPKTKKQQALIKAEKSPVTHRETSSDAGSELSTDSGGRVCALDKAVTTAQSNWGKLEDLRIASKTVTTNMTYGEIQEQLILKVVETPQMLMGDDVRKSVKPAYKYGLNSQQKVESEALTELNVVDRKKNNCAVDFMALSNKMFDGRDSVTDSAFNLQSYARRPESTYSEQMKLLTATSTTNHAALPGKGCDLSRTISSDNSQVLVHRLIENLIAEYNKEQHAEKRTQSIATAQGSLNECVADLFTAEIYDNKPCRGEDQTNPSDLSCHRNEKVVARKKKKVPTATLR